MNARRLLDPADLGEAPAPVPRPCPYTTAEPIELDNGEGRAWYVCTLPAGHQGYHQLAVGDMD